MAERAEALEDIDQIDVRCKAHSEELVDVLAAAWLPSKAD